MRWRLLTAALVANNGTGADGSFFACCCCCCCEFVLFVCACVFSVASRAERLAASSGLLWSGFVVVEAVEATLTADLLRLAPAAAAVTAGFLAATVDAGADSR